MKFKQGLTINSFPIEAQFQTYGYLKNQFEVNRKQTEFIHIAINDIAEFPAKLKFALLRNGIDDIAKLLKLNRQDLLNMSGVGPKSRKMIERFCKNYTLN